MNARLRIFTALVVLALYGIGPSLLVFADVKQSGITPAKAWSENPGVPLSSSGATLIGSFPERQWWEKFQDPNLNAYINAAIQNNPTLSGAMHRVTEARALTAEVVAQQLPSINLNPSYYHVGLPSNVRNAIPISSNLNLFTLPLQASYELDLWGKNRDASRSSRRQSESTELQSRAVLTTLLGDVASNYFNLIRTDSLMNTQTYNLTLLKRVADLKESQHQMGLESFEEVLRARRAAAIAATELANLKQQQGLFAHQLSILTGSPPANAAQLSRASLDALKLPLETASGSPGELLARRPDILAQEKLLESASIDVSVARKAFLPSINLAGLVGTGAVGFSKLWDWGNVFNLQSAAISQPLFHGGKLKAELNYRKAKQKEQLENYRQTVLTALKEVEDSLSNLKNGYENMENYSQQVELTERTVQLTQSLYQQGLVPRLDVLQAESELVRYRQNVIRGKADTAIATISLYRALGGGF